MSSDPKELLIATIREWIDTNNQITDIMKTVKEYRTKKKQC